MNVVDVGQTTEEDRKQFPFLEIEAPIAHRSCVPNLGQRLSRCAYWQKCKKHKSGDVVWSPVDPPDKVVQAVLAVRQWPGIRPLRGIIETPTLRADGTMMDVVGYDPTTGFLYAPSETFPAVPDRPTLADAQIALAQIEGIFVDFPFKTRGDLSVAVAAVLTLIARPAIGASPIFAFDAATPGTGKSLVVDAIHAVVTGRAAPKMSYPTDPRGANDEVRKMLDAAAIMGVRTVVFDNIRLGVKFGGSAIEQIVTTGTHEGRVLQRSELFRVPWTAVLFVTGNNLSMAPETLRRTLCARMVSGFERPESRPLSSYQHSERIGTEKLLGWIRAERPKLVCAALTLLRAFVVAGRPTQQEPYGSFESWSALIGAAMVWAGGCDPAAQVMSSHEEQEPVDRSVLRVVLRDLPSLSAGEPLSIKELKKRLYPEGRVPGDLVFRDDGFEDLREAVLTLVPNRVPRTPLDERALGTAFSRRLRDQLLQGRKLVSVGMTRDKTTLWQVVDESAKPVCVAGSETLTQAQHEELIKRARKAIIDDEGMLYPPAVACLTEFLVLARTVQVEQQSLAETRTKMKELFDSIWAAKGVTPLLPRDLKVVSVLMASPTMAEVLERSLGA